jgi:hypothetical protein
MSAKSLFSDIEIEVLICLKLLKTLPIEEPFVEKKRTKPKKTEFIVKCIKSHQYINGYLMFHTFWEGYSDEEATFEPRESFKIEGTRRYIDIFTNYCRANGLTL